MLEQSLVNYLDSLIPIITDEDLNIISLKSTYKDTTIKLIKISKNIVGILFNLSKELKVEYCRKLGWELVQAKYNPCKVKPINNSKIRCFDYYTANVVVSEGTYVDEGRFGYIITDKFLKEPAGLKVNISNFSYWEYLNEKSN